MLNIQQFRRRLYSAHARRIDVDFRNYAIISNFVLETINWLDWTSDSRCILDKRVIAENSHKTFNAPEALIWCNVNMCWQSIWVGKLIGIIWTLLVICIARSSMRHCWMHRRPRYALRSYLAWMCRRRREFISKDNNEATSFKFIHKIFNLNLNWLTSSSSSSSMTIQMKMTTMTITPQPYAFATAYSEWDGGKPLISHVRRYLVHPFNRRHCTHRMHMSTSKFSRSRQMKSQNIDIIKWFIRVGMGDREIHCSCTCVAQICVWRNAPTNFCLHAEWELLLGLKRWKSV